ncbi:hypothetical protein F5051DRAFT_151597 [Lentinula edodes]|nr:hypothetical protein F5051DRAFT_151597 [Lentinula edodes]
MGRKHRKTQKQKKAAKNRASNANEKETFADGEYRARSQQAREFSDEMYRRLELQRLNCQAWEAYVQEEVDIYTGSGAYNIILKESLGVLATLGVLLVLLFTDEVFIKLFEFQSHPNAIFSVVYLFCCGNTGIALSMHAYNGQIWASIAADGLPFLRSARPIYYGLHPQGILPSSKRNPFSKRVDKYGPWNTVIAPLRILFLKFLSKFSFIILYFPFLVFWLLSRSYDAFPTQWWTIVGALGTFTGVLKFCHSFLGEPIKEGDRMAEEEHMLYHMFWRGLGFSS